MNDGTASPARTISPSMQPWRLVAICCGAALLEGFDLQAPGVIAPAIKASIGMTPGNIALFVSMSTFGLMIGSALGGRASDLHGRKRVLSISVFAFGVFSIATAFARTFDQLLIFRFLTGLGLGGAMPNLVAIAAESVPQARRTTAIGFLYASMPFGGGCASLLSASLKAPGDWPTVFLAGGFGPIIILAPILWLLPEDRGVRPVPLDVQRAPLINALFGEGRAAATIWLWLGFFTTLLTLYLILGWLPSLMVARGLSRSQASLIQTAYNFCGAIGSVITGSVIGGPRRRWVIGAVFLAALGSVTFVGLAPADFAVLFMGAAVLGATLSGSQAVIYALAPEHYSTPTRATGVGWAIAAGRVGAISGPLIAGALTVAGQSPTEVILLFTPSVLISACSCLVLARPRPDF